VFQGYMPPDSFALGTSGEIVVQTVIGGVGTLLGPAIGAAIWLTLRQVLQSIPSLVNFWLLILGAVFVILVTFLREGVFGALRKLFDLRRHLRAPATAPSDIRLAPEGADLHLVLAAPEPPSAPNALETKRLTVRFGGLIAVDDVSLAIPRGALHAVIGPNGAGKTTLFRMLAAEIQPTQGQVLLHGRDITGIGATRACQAGVSKSYQINQLFPKLTVRQNLRISALARSRGRFRLDLLRDAASIERVEEQVERVMQGIGLDHRADMAVGVLAYGEKRRVEIGLALASGPSVLLLDEPLAGMSPEERSETKTLIRSLRAGRTLVIVEHDMDAIFELADRITVLANGRLLAQGTVAEIQENPEVQAAYLGGVSVYELA
jgi:branched-chain amino acid transport system permease protein